MFVIAIIGALGGVPYIWLGVLKVCRFIKSNILNADISCRVLRHSLGEGTCNTEIKLAYVGEKPAILSEILVSYYLKLRPRIRGIMAWVNIAAGYLTCDMKGLSTILGTEWYINYLPLVHRWKSPLKYPISVVTGLYVFYFLLLGVLFVPTVIPFLFLMSGPYGRFTIDSIADTMTLVGADGSKVKLPIVLNKGDELLLKVKYRIGINAKGFPVETPFRFLSDLPKMTVHPPKPGNFA
jgi:hypothetical protein